MPELPEVQTTVNQLAQRICGSTIVRAWMDKKKSIHVGSNMSWSAMQKYLAKQNITAVTRRAKYIVIHLAGEAKLWVHQKMTGHLLVKDAADTKGEWKYIRLILHCTNGTTIGLSDARRFARVILTRSDQEIPQVKELAHLGPEPLELSCEQFIALFEKKRGAIKSVLMDPRHIVGIGNIYADEILHRAGIHPFTLISCLSRDDLVRIHQHMHAILTVAIKLGGSSTHDYRTPDGSLGGYQHKHLAYQRTGKACTLCGAGIIERLFRNGRSSHFCSHHQKTL